MKWLLIMATLHSTSVIHTFKIERECRDEARAYNISSFRDEIFYCKKA